MIGIDTNILVYAIDESSVYHRSAVDLMASLLAEESVAIADYSLMEFYAVVTDGRKVRAPLTPGQAVEAIQKIQAMREVSILHARLHSWERSFQLAVEHDLSRYEHSDALIAAIMEEYGVSEFVTLNQKHFRRFDFLSLRDCSSWQSEMHSGNQQGSSDPFIPYGRQTIDERDVAAVCNVLRSDWLTTGPAVEGFERAVAESCNVQYAVAVSNGTAALHCAMYAIDLQAGDEVITTPMTFAASANAVLYMGATPVFADVLKDSLLIDPAQVEAKITERTKAVIAVDYAGQPCDYETLNSICRKHNLKLIADACHSIGGSYKERAVGSLADLSVFSFHPVKHVTTGEGGMVLTDSDDFAAHLRCFRNHGITTDHRQRAEKGQWFYEMVDLGFNYRITDIQCALGKSQLPKLPAWIERRNELAKRYDRSFADVPGIIPLTTHKDCHNAYHLYVVRVDQSAYGCDRDALFTRLREANIGAQVHYIPVHLHPYYREQLGWQAGACPVAEAAYSQILSLPMFPALTDAEQERVISTVNGNE